MHDGVVDDIKEIAENSAYLRAVEEKGACLDILNSVPPYTELHELEAKLVESGAITFDNVFHEPCGYYNLRNFMISDYAVERIVFLHDVEKYKQMRAESARRKVSKLLYDRFISPDEHEIGRAHVWTPVT